jgi:hypothetical protein
MSNTGFIVTNNGTDYDLSVLFQPRGSTQPASNTGFIASDGNNLSNWFEAYTSGNKAITTNYRLSDGTTDLNSYFRKKVTSSYIATGTFTTTTGTIDGTIYNTILKFTSGTSNTIQINGDTLNLNYFIVGGGVSGGTGSSNSGIGYKGGRGGGAGQYIKNSFTSVSGTTYTISIGGSNTSSSITTIVTSVTGTNGTSGNGFGPGSALGNTNVPGAGGGGGTAAGNSSTGGTGQTFFGATYSVGGNGGVGGGTNGTAGATNTGNGGNGGNGNTSSSGPFGTGGAGGSGVVFIYFNI